VEAIDESETRNSTIPDMTRKYKPLKINRNGDHVKSKAGFGWDNGIVAFGNPLDYVGKNRKIREKDKER
jgi:hypothetical protein